MSADRRRTVLVIGPVPASELERLGQLYRVETRSWTEDVDRRTLTETLRAVDGVVTPLTITYDREVLGAVPDLRVIANIAVGFDNVDVEAATDHGIVVCNTPGVLDDATADLALALLLAAARRVAEGDRLVRSGGFDSWNPQLLLGRDIVGGTLGIVGLGRIGTALARRAALGFGLRIVYTARSAKPEVERELGAVRLDLDELLRRSDFVSLHVPLNGSTHHLIGARELGLMKSDAILVNTSRGPVIDERALVEVLREGKIFAAGLDVFEDEPRLAPGLAELDNVVLLPHIGSATVGTRRRMAELATSNLIAVLEGEGEAKMVNPEAR